MPTKKRGKGRADVTFGIERPSRSGHKSETGKATNAELTVKLVKFTVELPEVTRRSLKAKAAIQGITMRELILAALKDAGVDVP